MKKALLTTALGLALAAPMASAQDVPISLYMDLNAYVNGVTDPSNSLYDTGLVTDIFQLLTTVKFTPVSEYTDNTHLGDNPNTTAIETDFVLAGGGDGVSTGDSVYDSAENVQIGLLNPIVNVSGEGGFGNTWGLSLDWSLNGTAAVLPDPLFDALDGVEEFNYVGLFTSGSMSINLTDGNGTIVKNDVLAIDYTHMVNSGIANNRTPLQLFGDAVSASEEMFYFTDGTSFESYLAAGTAIQVEVSGDLIDLSSVPLDDGDTANSGDLTANDGVYTRKTLLNSFDVAVVPEPTSVAILGLGLLGLGLSRKRKQQ